MIFKEKEEIGDFGFHVDNRDYATDQSQINEVNQQTFQQLSQNIKDSEVNELILDAELNQVSRKSDSKLGKRNQGPQISSQILPMPRKKSTKKSDAPTSSNRQSNSGQFISSRGVSYDSEFSIGDHGYVGDLDKIATGSGTIESPQYTADNQGHNYVKDSDVNGKLIAIVIATST